MTFRKAFLRDIDAIEEIYDQIHTEEEAGRVTIGWERNTYPTRATAEASFSRDDLFVLEDEGHIVGAAIINQLQVDVYADAPWEFPAPDDKVTVLHTLVISPKAQKRGYGKAFVAFYEDYAKKNGAPYLRMDTNERNSRARNLYRSLGYREIGIAPCVFNGIEGVGLVLLEKKI